MYTKELPPTCCHGTMSQQHTMTVVSGAQTPAQQRYGGRRVRLEGWVCRHCFQTHTTRRQVARNQRRMWAALAGLQPLMIPPRSGQSD